MDIRSGNQSDATATGKVLTALTASKVPEITNEEMDGNSWYPAAMKACKMKRWAGLALILATAEIHALELGRFEQNTFGGLQGMIDIMVENKDKVMDVYIEEIEQYDLVAVPWGATILLRSDEKLPEEFTVTVTYGNQKIRRKYSAKASHQNSDRYVVKKGENISNISEAIRAKTGGTFYQRAIALIMANPGAFKESDPTALKGSDLIIPSPERVTEISDQDAHAQYQKWIAFGKATQNNKAQKSQARPTNYATKASQQYTDRYSVKKGEGLSNISEAIKAETGGTFYQRAIALIMMNPGAFKESDPTALKGIDLIIPSPEKVAEISDQDAHAQYRKWIAFGKATQISKAQKAKPEPTQQERSQPAVANMKKVTAAIAIPVHQKDDDETAHPKQIDTELGILERMIAQMEELLVNIPKQPTNIDNEDEP